jgi:predicted RNase H-like HicB family nuclease
MKQVYPIILTPAKRGYVVYVPDFEINTEGNSLPDAIAMARDAIAMTACYREDHGEAIPAPATLSLACEQPQVCALVDVDFAAYRRANETRVVRRNVTLPSWLNVEAEHAGLNVSRVLQEALKARLGIE